MTDEQRQTIYAEILDVIAEEEGHVAPPPGSFTVDDYIERTEAKGFEEMSTSVALSALLRQVKRGVLEARKLKVGGRRRWVFWAANGQGDQGDAING